MNTIFSTKWHQGDESKKWARIFSTEKTPQSVGPYSKAVKSWPFLFCSGQVWIVPITMKLAEGGIEAETLQACKNIEGVLEEHGLQMKHVVKTTVFLKNLSDYKAMNTIYATHFSHRPARSCVEVSNLPLWALIEIEVIAEV